MRNTLQCLSAVLIGFILFTAPPQHLPDPPEPTLISFEAVHIAGPEWELRYGAKAVRPLDVLHLESSRPDVLPVEDIYPNVADNFDANSLTQGVVHLHASKVTKPTSFKVSAWLNRGKKTTVTAKAQPYKETRP